MRHEGNARGVQVGAKALGSLHEAGLFRGVLVLAPHLAAESLELVQRQVSGTALDSRKGVSRSLSSGGVAGGGCKFGLALVLEIRLENVRGLVQIALRTPAHQMPVLGDGNLAANHASSLLGSRSVRLYSVLW